MQSKVDQLITEAKYFLQNKAYDQAHDLDHHLQVWKNVQKISQKTEVHADLIALQIAAMWHDVITEKKYLGKNSAKRRTANYVAKRMTAFGFTATTIKKTKTAILEHSVMNTQTILESKILADADLIEWFNPNRLQKILEIYTTSQIKKKALKIFTKKWLKKIPKLIHFESTQKIIIKKIKELKKNQKMKNLIEEQGEKIESYLKVFN